MKLPKRRRPSDEHPDVLKARAEAMSEACGIAATYELKMADAGTVRMVLGHKALEAWKTYFARVEPERALDAASVTQGSPPSPVSDAASSESSALMASSVPSALSAAGGNDDSLDSSSNVIEMQFAHDAGDICHRCGEVVTWVEHLPPVGLYSPVRCFVDVVEERRRLGYSVKVPE